MNFFFKCILNGKTNTFKMCIPMPYINVDVKSFIPRSKNNNLCLLNVFL